MNKAEVIYLVPWNIYVESGTGSFTSLRVITIGGLWKEFTVIIPVQ